MSTPADPAAAPVVADPAVAAVVADPAAAPVADPAVAAAADPAATPAAQVDDNTVPEAYADFTLPDGFDASQINVDDVKAVAKDLGLSQAKAQKLVDRVIQQRKDFETAQADNLDKQIAKWADEARADPEIGGDKFDASLAAARSVIENPALVSPAFKVFLDASGLGNHPEMIRFASRVQPAFANDSPVVGGGVPQGDPIARMYDHPTSQPAKG